VLLNCIVATRRFVAEQKKAVCNISAVPNIRDKILIAEQDLNQDLGAGRRFAVAPSELGFGHRLAILSDFGYWVEHDAELVTWCERNNAILEGATVELATDQDLVMFLLRWSP
jgi:hypothetical protein